MQKSTGLSRNKPSFVSINDFENKMNRSLFISSEVTEQYPFVHHFYILDQLLHYLVYDPVDDVVVDYFSGEKLDAFLFEYERSAYLNIFDLHAFYIVSRITKANHSFIPNTTNSLVPFLTKIHEDISLIMNRSQLDSAGYLVEGHLLSNSITGIQMKKVLGCISASISNAINRFIDNGENYDPDMVVLLFKHIDAVDKAHLSLINELPLPLDDIKSLKRAVLTREVVNQLLHCDEFKRLNGSKYLDMMLGKKRFTCNPLMADIQI